MAEMSDRVDLGTYPSGTLATLTHADRRRHAYIVGKTGAGKSTLLLNMLLADLGRDHGFALLDPHGDLAEAVVNAIPPRRTNDVIYIDPADLTHAVGLNPLAGIEPDRRALAAAHVVAAFKHIWGDSWGPRLEYILTQSLRLLLEAPGSTLLGLPRLLIDPGYRNRLLAHARDPMVINFWCDEFEQYSERFAIEAVAPIQNKIGTLLSPPVVRNILAQPRSTIDIRTIMDSGRVLIVNLSKGRLGEAPAHLLGALLTTMFAQAAEARAGIPESERRDFTLYADEFQNFATDSFATILSEARKYRLAVVLAHQFLGQLPPLLRQAVFGNVGTLIAFRVGAEDAPLLAREFALQSDSALTESASYTAWLKLMRDGLPLEPHHIATLPAIPTHAGRRDFVRRRTAARHARPRLKVEANVNRFLNG